MLAIGDAAFADLYREALASVGWHVDVRHDWRSTQDQLKYSMPDVLVLDTLPDLKQVDTLETIRAHEATSALPVVLLTDTLETGELERAKDLGVLGFLIKTRATRQTLPETLRKLLGKRASADLSQG